MRTESTRSLVFALLGLTIALLILTSCTPYGRLNRRCDPAASELLEDYGHHVLWGPEQNDPKTVDSMKRVIRQYLREHR